MAWLQLLNSYTSIHVSHEKRRKLTLSLRLFICLYTQSKHLLRLNYLLSFVNKTTYYLKAPNKAATLGRLIKAFTNTEPRIAGIV